MITRPPRSTRTDTLFPYTTLFRSLCQYIGFLRRRARSLFLSPARWPNNIARSGWKQHRLARRAKGCGRAVQPHRLCSSDYREDRKSVVSGKSVLGRVDLVGLRIFKKKKAIITSILLNILNTP